MLSHFFDITSPLSLFVPIGSFVDNENDKRIIFICYMFDVGHC